MSCDNRTPVRCGGGTSDTESSVLQLYSTLIIDTDKFIQI
jgi:hypothetical protein